ncbi:MAG TPA: glycosyl hydrolase [Bryobacteraceae bacterium]|nr:glycosyl hydrolase [Bryobacteraceae bacterium]
MTTRKAILSVTATTGLMVLVGWALAQGPGTALDQGFKDPPDSAKPRTWWHWTMSNISKEGITKDLEWMKRAGIGGFQLADVNAGSGQTVEKKIVFGTPEWLDAVRHAASEADRLGLEMTIFSGPGWSETGGKWVQPEQAMKKLVWSETTVEGPRNFTGKLPPPPSNNGPIRNLATGGGRGGAPPDPTYYGDSAVVAYRTPPEESRMADLHPKVTTNAGPIDATPLLDDDLNTALTIAAPEGGGPAWVQFEFAQPFRARSLSIAGRGGIPVGRLLASDDGSGFRTLAVLPGPQGYRGGPARTFAFPEAAAKFYRVELSGAPLGPAAVMAQAPPLPAKEYVLTEAVLSSGARVNRWEEKAGFIVNNDFDSMSTPPVPASAAIRRDGIVDLTSKMAKDGSLNWDIPSGRWTILRMGYSLTGSKNRPAVPAASGYEVDKLSRKYVETYFHGYLDPISQALGPLVGKSLKYMIMDSWEAGMQNWTDDMIAEFRTRRGYDPTPFLPVLAGRVVESAEVSDRFLWDFRRTVADMFAENHFGTIADMLHQRGMGSYAEAAGVSMEIMEDTLLNKSKVDIPMGEFWVHALHPELMYYVDVRGAASAAHAYGKNLVATESYTGGGYEAPATLKRVGDYWFAQGVNRIVFHTSAHQPLDTKPGNTMVGTHINRNITWAELARPYMTYMARNSFMLQQGQFVADLAYLLNEGAPSTQSFWGSGIQPAPPDGYDYDCINADVLLKRMSVGDDGRLMLPDGMTYRVLVLPEAGSMTLPVLRKIRELVAGGATVVGPKPLKSPGLTGYPGVDSEVESLAAALWGDTDGVSRTQHLYGKGKVMWGVPLSDVLAAQHVQKDFDCSRPLDSDLPWIHRRTADTDIYYVDNHTDHAQDLEARFRVGGKQAELWHPDTGAIEPAGFTIADGRTTVPLHLAERESVFVVFRRTAPMPSRAIPRAVSTAIAPVSGAWDVSFPPNFGAPSKIQLARLQSWTANPDEGVKYFSGTATYTKTVDAPQTWFRPGAKLLLNLGTVRDIAEVSLNGKDLGMLWKPPYEVDVTGVLKAGANQLEIKVTNEWTNRQIGDRLAPPEKRVLAGPGSMPMGGRGGGGGFGGPQAPADSGLIGPVMLLASAVPQVLSGIIAGIPVNYDESQVGTYTLPNPLVLANGQPVRDAKTWNEKRRPEIVKLFEENEYGRTPGRPKDMSFDVFDKGTPAFDGKAVRRQVTIYFSADKNGPKTDLLIYLPAGATKPVPLLLNISFSANSSTVDDTGVKQGEMWSRDQKRVPAPRGVGIGRLNVAPILDKGFGVATMSYGDIDPDFLGGVPLGVRALYLKPGQKEPAPDEWGAISAWAWGLSRAVDYFETDKGVDAKRIAIMGVSRLGKTVMWAGAHDPRIAMVIASCSGEGGAALSRRNYGETIAHLVEPSRYPYQFCANYAKYASHVDQLPVDAHMLVALIAPRPVLLQTGTTDNWSDPKGEFLAAVAAGPVYRLLGKQGLDTDQWPAAGQPILHDIGYFMHAGGHGTLPSDWEVFLKFMEMHLQTGK